MAEGRSSRSTLGREVSEHLKGTEPCPLQPFSKLPTLLQASTLKTLQGGRPQRRTLQDMDAPTENTPAGSPSASARARACTRPRALTSCWPPSWPAAGGGQGERPLTQSRREAVETPEPALTLTSLPSGVLHQILLQLEEPADLGRTACVNQLLNRAVAPLTPALFYYSQEGDAARVIELLGRPSVLVGIAAAHTGCRITALHVAASRGHNEIVSALLEAGAPVDARSLDEWTPIMYAALGPSHPEVVNLLRAAGAVVEAGNATWAQIFVDGTYRGDYQSVDLVLSLGVPPEAATAAGSWTPLMIAAAKGRDDIAQRLLDSGGGDGAPPGLWLW